MKTHSNEIMLIYNPESEWAKRTVAHATSLAPHVKVYTFEQAPITRTGWQSIIKSLDIPAEDLLDTSLPEYREQYKGRDLKEEDWLDVLVRNPHLVKAPIGVRGTKVILCKSPTDIHQLTDTDKYEE